MEEIIKVLLLEGIDEVTIHRVLDVIEEEYEIISELDDRTLRIGSEKAERIENELRKIEPELDGEKKEFTKKQIAKRNRQKNKMRNYYENQVVAREEGKYRAAKRKKENKSGEEQPDNSSNI